MNTKLKLILFLTAIILCNVQGQEKLSLSLEDAKNYALEYNKMIKNADLAVKEAQKKINETISIGLPQADATVDYSNFLGAEMELSFGEGLPPRIIPFNPTSNLNITVSQLIFSGSYIVGLQSVKLYREMSEKNLLKTEQDIKVLVTNYYTNALLAEHTVEILTKSYQNTQEIFEKTKTMESVGMAEKLDVDQFKVQLSSLENSLKAAERQRELVYNLLRLQLGVSANTSIELTDSLSDLMGGLEYEMLTEKSMILDNNLDYQLMSTQERLSEKQITLKKMGYLPTLSGFYNYTNKILKPELDFSPKNIVGLNLSIPIFSSGMRNSQLSQAKIQYETTINNKELLEDQLLLQEKQSRYNLMNAMEQYENRKNNVEVAFRVFKSYKLKFEQGVASSLDLTQSSNSYLQAESEYAMAVMNLLEAQISLQKLMNLI